MVRPVTLSEKPPFNPYVCIQCGVGQEPRKWFLDLGFSLDYYFNPVNEGTVYICDECWSSLIVSVDNCIKNYKIEHEAWDSPDRVLPTYEWQKKNDVRGRELPAAEGDSTVSEGDNSGTESNDSEPEPSTTDSSDSTDEPDDAAKQAFTAFFGESELSG